MSDGVLATSSCLRRDTRALVRSLCAASSNSARVHGEICIRAFDTYQIWSVAAAPGA
jgi:hypothetical protein